MECVVTIGIDDMRSPEPYEAYLRPILARLTQVDGRAPASIFTNSIDPNHPQLQTWLKEGLSLETHTADHPCPCLQGGRFDTAKSTYDRCVDQLASVPGNHPVAFRFPCMDSMNTPSPRSFMEIVNGKTPQGNFLQMSSSVCQLFTPNDPSIPRDLVYDQNDNERFARYAPFKSFVNLRLKIRKIYVLLSLNFFLKMAVLYFTKLSAGKKPHRTRKINTSTWQEKRSRRKRKSHITSGTM